MQLILLLELKQLLVTYQILNLNWMIRNFETSPGLSNLMTMDTLTIYNSLTRGPIVIAMNFYSGLMHTMEEFLHQLNHLEIVLLFIFKLLYLDIILLMELIIRY